MNRRKFIHQSTVLTGAALVLGQLKLSGMEDGPAITKVVILHTNDVHSRIEPFPMDGSRNQGRGGAARRSKLIQEIRKQEENVLLFDSGDMFQGTPYFNFYLGELEIKLMNAMKYDAATIGNHDFDGGMDNLAKQIKEASFPIVQSNYEMKDTAMNGLYQEYKIFQKGKVKIGVFAVGIELKGLVPTNLYGATKYYDPIIKAQMHASVLKNEHKCDYVVCLSHLGYKYGGEERKVSDIILAQETQGIDLILGGHTHTFLDEPTKVTNKAGKTTLVNQAGWGGMAMGRIDLWFERNGANKCITCKNLPI
jgi:5'-nucleotidase